MTDMGVFPLGCAACPLKTPPPFPGEEGDNNNDNPSGSAAYYGTDKRDSVV